MALEAGDDSDQNGEADNSAEPNRTDKADATVTFEPNADGSMDLPTIALRDVVFFPGDTVKFEVSRRQSRAAVHEAVKNKSPLFLVAQRDEDIEEPLEEDLYRIGVVAEHISDTEMPNNITSVCVRVQYRARIAEIVRYKPCIMARVNKADDKDTSEPLKKEAYIRLIKSQFRNIDGIIDTIPPAFTDAILKEDKAEPLVNRLSAHMIAEMDDRVALLDEDDIGRKLEMLAELLEKTLHIIEIEGQLAQEVGRQIDKSQKEYYLREQLRVIHKELGDREASAVDEYRAKAIKLPLNDEAREKVMREIDRLEGMQGGSPEADTSATYIEWVLALPWGKAQTSKIDTARARRTLDKDHYGLDKVKERLIEYLAVRALKNDMKGPCICLVGPPGVGKTSIAHSVAKALKRPLAHVSLGGVHDESEIRGHRRTYVGAMPGRIMSAMRQAGSMTPVFLFDEIDKMGMDYRGDPASAMLEVLDGEQNSAFRDTYLDIPFDLSGVLFIMTANSLDSVPRPLLDRMEVIQIEGYTAREKLEIAKRHLFAKQLKENGLDKKQLKLKQDAFESLIEEYTREAGVRQLERQIGTICRKTACKLLEDTTITKVTIGAEDVHKLLGPAKYRRQPVDKLPEIGMINGLAWTEVGGETLAVEAAVMPGSGRLELTGQLGDVMQESAKAALSIIRMRSDALGLERDFYKNSDLHVHVPEGAVPKDGPSAGVTITCALASALTGRPARQDVAMTGEITLRGKVLPIGGVKEKVLAAHRMGIRTVLLPRDNESDLEDIPGEVRSDLTLKLISSVSEALDTVLLTGDGSDKRIKPQ